MGEIEIWTITPGRYITHHNSLSWTVTNIQPRPPENGEPFEVVRAEQLRGAVEALRVADNLLRQFSISANDHSELIRREFGKAQQQINAALGG
jgi:hypothetical protein